MNDENHQTLCAYVEDGLHINDPKAYIALLSYASQLLQRLRPKGGKSRKRL